MNVWPSCKFDGKIFYAFDAQSIEEPITKPEGFL